MRLAIAILAAALASHGKPYAGVVGSGATAPAGTTPSVENTYRSQTGVINPTSTVNVSTGGTNRVLLAFVQATGGNPIAGVAGGGLTWNLAASAVSHSSISNWGTALYWAPAPTQLSSVAITATVTGGGDGDFVVVVVKDAKASGPIGAAVGRGDLDSSLHAVTLTPTGSGSLVVAAFNDGSSGLPPARSGTTINEWWLAGTGDNYWTAYSASPPTQGVAYTIGSTTSDTNLWTGVAVEFLAGP